MSVKKRGLGRGLDALLTTGRPAATTTEPTTEQQVTAAERHQHELQKLPIEWLKPGKYQPRKDMSQDALEPWLKCLVSSKMCRMKRLSRSR